MVLSKRVCPTTDDGWVKSMHSNPLLFFGRETLAAAVLTWEDAAICGHGQVVVSQALCSLFANYTAATESETPTPPHQAGSQYSFLSQKLVS